MAHLSQDSRPPLPCIGEMRWFAIHKSDSKKALTPRSLPSYLPTPNGGLGIAFPLKRIVAEVTKRAPFTGGPFASILPRVGVTPLRLPAPWGSLYPPLSLLILTTPLISQTSRWP